MLLVGEGELILPKSSGVKAATFHPLPRVAPQERSFINPRVIAIYLPHFSVRNLTKRDPTRAPREKKDTKRAFLNVFCFSAESVMCSKFLLKNSTLS